MTDFNRIAGHRVRVPVFHSEGDHSRNTSEKVFWGRLEIPALDSEVRDAWIAQAIDRGLQDSGDITAVNAPARGWDAFEQVQTQLHRWAQQNGFEQAVANGSVSVLACYGASFHTDGDGFPDTAFCVVWLGQDCGQDLLFPHLDVRIPLTYGTVVLFDSAQPHGVVERGASQWVPDEYFERRGKLCQCFLSWDMEIHREELAALMEVSVEPTPPGRHASHMTPFIEGYRADVEQDTGAWEY